MSVNLQVKRTVKNPSTLSNVVLLKGEQLYCYYSGLVKPCIIVGDGIKSVAQLYNDGNFTYVSKDPVINTGYITSNMVLDGTIAHCDLADYSVGTNNIIPGSVGESQLDQNLYNSLLKVYQYDQNYGQLLANKVHYAICRSPASARYKEISIPELQYLLKSRDVNGVRDIYLPIENLVGLTIIVKFIYSTTTAESSILKVNIPYSFTIDGVVYNGTETFSYTIWMSNSVTANKLTSWAAGEFVIFTLNNVEGNYRWQNSTGATFEYLRNWCYNNNMTLINGGLIATGTVTAEKIAAGSITADKIRAGSITADKFVSGIIDDAIFNSASFEHLTELCTNIEKQTKSSRQYFFNCLTSSNSSVKEIMLSEEEADGLMPGGTIRDGTTAVVNFRNTNTADDVKLYFSINGVGTTHSYDVVYLDNSFNTIPLSYSNIHSDPLAAKLNWGNNSCRLFVFMNNQFICLETSSVTQQLAEYCSRAGITYINGGTLISGKISCSELDAGTIDASKISLSCGYGGFAAKNGLSGTGTITNGIKMYAGNDVVFPKNSVFITDSGILIKNTGDTPDSTTGEVSNYARIGLWGNSITLDATGYIKFTGLPTSDAGLPTGAIYNDSGTLKIKQ